MGGGRIEGGSVALRWSKALKLSTKDYDIAQRAADKQASRSGLRPTGVLVREANGQSAYYTLSDRQRADAKARK